MIEQQKQRLQEIIDLKEQRLHELLKQQAMHGINTPPHINIEIKSLNDDISSLQNILNIDIKEGLKENTRTPKSEKIKNVAIYIFGGFIVISVILLGMADLSRFLPSSESIQITHTRLFVTDENTKYWLKLYNCDDTCTAYIGSNIFDKARWGDGKWKEIPRPVNGETIELMIEIRNDTKGYTYGVMIRKNENEKPEEDYFCGKTGQYGCENDTQNTNGIVKRFLYEFK